MGSVSQDGVLFSFSVMQMPNLSFGCQGILFKDSYLEQK